MFSNSIIDNTILNASKSSNNTMKSKQLQISAKKLSKSKSSKCKVEYSLEFALNYCFLLFLFKIIVVVTKNKFNLYSNFPSSFIQYIKIHQI